MCCGKAIRRVEPPSEAFKRMKSVIAGKGLLDAAGSGFAGLIGDGRERRFGTGVRTRVAGDISWVDLRCEIREKLVEYIKGGIRAACHDCGRSWGDPVWGKRDRVRPGTGIKPTRT